MDNSIYEMAQSYINQHPDWITDTISSYEHSIFIFGIIATITTIIILVWMIILFLIKESHNQKIESNYWKWDLDDVPSFFGWLLVTTLGVVLVIVMIGSIITGSYTINDIQQDPVLYLANRINSVI